MATNNEHIVVSPTVLHVIEQFVAAMRGDAEIADYAVDRLNSLLHKGSVPKLDEINAALFDPPVEDEA